VLWKGTLAIEGGTAAAMSIVASTLMSDGHNYVRPSTSNHN
jgi:hypothetical protein